MKWKTEYKVVPTSTRTNDPEWAAKYLTDRLNQYAAEGWSLEATAQVSGAVVFVKRTRITDDERVDEIMSALELEITGELDIKMIEDQDDSIDKITRAYAGDDAIRAIVRRALEEDWR